MNGSKDKVTMKTIAEEAGVTLTTVSRILNHKGDKYAAGTKQRIFEIAERLRYRPNALVRGMQTGRTGTAGVMVPASNPYYMAILGGIHDVFIENDTIMLLSWNNRSLNDREEVLERQIIHQMLDRRVEGILLRPSSEDFERSYFEEIWERDVPLILIDRELSNIRTDFVGTDDFLGGQKVAEYLISLGHRRMLFVGVGQTVSTSRYREAGFRNVLSESAHAFCHSMDFNDDTAPAELLQRLKDSQAPTAIFGYNDEVARAAAEIILQAGLTIPGDVSLVGFGNVPCADCTVSLTTFDQHPQQIGVTAAKLYLDRTTGKSDDGVRQLRIEPELVVRHSTRTIGSHRPHLPG